VKASSVVKSRFVTRARDGGSVCLCGVDIGRRHHRLGQLFDGLAGESYR
jgi:hypothetical protein